VVSGGTGSGLMRHHFCLLLVTEGGSEDEPRFKEWGIDSTSSVEQLESYTRKCLVLKRGDDLGPAIH